ncbi:MAG: transcription elongation factor subunit Spt4 [Candidatus Altiarchaeota archaeon]
MRACKSCLRISEEERCPVCGGATSQYWSGYLAVIDPEMSKIAKRMDLKTPGQYALKVR